MGTVPVKDSVKPLKVSGFQQQRSSEDRCFISFPDESKARCLEIGLELIVNVMFKKSNYLE